MLMCVSLACLDKNFVWFQTQSKIKRWFCSVFILTLSSVDFPIPVHVSRARTQHRQHRQRTRLANILPIAILNTRSNRAYVIRYDTAANGERMKG